MLSARRAPEPTPQRHSHQGVGAARAMAPRGEPHSEPKRQPKRYRDVHHPDHRYATYCEPNSARTPAVARNGKGERSGAYGDVPNIDWDAQDRERRRHHSEQEPKRNIADESSEPSDDRDGSGPCARKTNRAHHFYVSRQPVLQPDDSRPVVGGCAEETADP
jgi:hypothetical protein